MDVQELWARMKNDAETLHAAQLTLQNENTKLQNENRLLKERFQRILLQQSLISLLQEGHSDSLPQRIKSYIDENYQDPETNVNAVADFFGISATYATKVFRGAYHSGVLDYIHQRRLFTAKELLGSGQSIAEIARQSGYGTSSNMIRAFKRIEGVTPGQLVSELETGGD